MEKIKCLIIDDEPVARQGLIEHVHQIEFLYLVAECKNAIEAAEWLQKEKIDLIFLDIQMPKISGIDFLKNLKNPPLTVFSTAYPEYAIEGFALDVIDYLIKPVSFSRFLKSAMKAKEYLYNTSGNNADYRHNDFFFVKCSNKIDKIMINEVLYVESMANYVVIYTKNKKYVTYLTFKGIEDQLPADMFVKIHRSYLVALSAIDSIEGNELTIGNIKLVISKNFRNDVMARISQFMLKR